MSEKMNNLKEVAGENVLDKDQLDQIAGGGYGQVAVDASFFHRLGLYAHTYSYDQLKDSEGLYERVLQDMSMLYSKYGIVCSCASGKANNTYFIPEKNQQLTLEQAQEYVRQQIKKAGK